MNNPNGYPPPHAPEQQQSMVPHPGHHHHYPAQPHAHGGYPAQAGYPPAHGYAPQPAPVNIVVQNTMNQQSGYQGGLVRVADRQKGVAVVLALFLGGLGVHRFYLGQIGLGVVYLMFCWTLIPAFIAMVEALLLLMMSAREFDMKYNTGLV